MVPGTLLIVLRRRQPDTGRIAITGGLLVAVGVGSVLYHGPTPAGAQFVHDATIGALFGFLAWWGAPGAFSHRWWLVAAGVALAGLGLVPTRSGLTLAVVGAVAALVVGVRFARVPALRARLGALTLVATAAGATAVLGATGAPWCSPESLLRAHAAWHVLGAVAVSLAAAAIAAAPAHAVPSAGRARDRITR